MDLILGKKEVGPSAIMETQMDTSSPAILRDSDGETRCINEAKSEKLSR